MAFSDRESIIKRIEAYNEKLSDLDMGSDEYVKIIELQERDIKTVNMIDEAAFKELNKDKLLDNELTKTKIEAEAQVQANKASKRQFWGKIAGAGITTLGSLACIFVTGNFEEIQGKLIKGSKTKYLMKPKD